tara:strand:- start:270 stop:890 length:621 start_codon:yes stop_codon:yes gene_type:complete
MLLNDYYWYFDSALSNKVCNEIINLGIKKGQEPASINGLTKPSKKEVKDLKKARDSNVAFISEPWIYDQIHPFINEANTKAKWDFQWDFSEACQFTKYSKNQFYDWHLDAWDEPYNNLNDKDLNGKIRKLSVTVSLSDPKDYEGGELEFDCRNELFGKKKNILTCNQIKPRGSIVVFPSFIWHRVKPIIKGTRYSLVLWNVGYPFK